MYVIYARANCSFKELGFSHYLLIGKFMYYGA